MSTREKSISDIQPSQVSGLGIFCIDFFLFTIAFFLSNLIKRGTVELSSGYSELLSIFYICWFVASFTGRKLEGKSYVTCNSGFFCFAKSALYMAYCIAFAIVILGISNVSRIQVFSTCLITFLLECITWGVYCKTFKFKEKGFQGKKHPSLQIEAEKSHFLFSLCAMDFFLLILAFSTVNFIKRSHLAFPPHYEILFLILLGLWFSVSLVTEKFKCSSNKNYTLALAQWLKTGAILLALIAVVVFGFRLFQFSRFQSFASILLLLLFETITLRLYFLWKQGDRVDSDIESSEAVQKILDQEELRLDVDIDKFRKNLLEPIREKLKEKLAAKDLELFDFIDEHIELDTILSLETASNNNGNLVSLTADPIPIRLLLNLRKINNIPRINKYFLETHKTLISGGYFISRTHTLATHKEWIYKKYPGYIANYVYAVDFFINRAIPKLPFFDKIYFALTKGHNRLISRAEVLGRLHFCGFEIAAEKIINQRLCVIARKIKTPSLDVNPTYGPLVELKRVGYQGKMINMYKLRTMHPYSEYLQQYIFDNFGGTIDGDGFQNDFRITKWGELFRKFWIDELPMLYNWIKGDVKLVGVRPLSQHKFSLYSSENQKIRLSAKPGLVPPFYADLPKDFEELQESEVKYTKSYHKNPITTDIRYFLSAMWNILINKARSK